MRPTPALKDYVITTLESGWVVAAVLAEHVRNAAGEIHLPPPLLSTPIAELDPRWSAGLKRQDASWVLQTALAGRSGCTLFIESDVMNVDDPSAATSGYDRMFGIDGRAYWHFDAGVSDPTEIATRMGALPGYRTVAWVVDQPVGNLPGRGHPLSRARIPELVAHTVAIIISAFDSESYLVWTPLR